MTVAIVDYCHYFHGHDSFVRNCSDAKQLSFPSTCCLINSNYLDNLKRWEIQNHTDWLCSDQEKITCLSCLKCGVIQYCEFLYQKWQNGHHDSHDSIMSDIPIFHCRNGRLWSISWLERTFRCNVERCLGCHYSAAKANIAINNKRNRFQTSTLPERINRNLHDSCFELKPGFANPYQLSLLQSFSVPFSFMKSVVPIRTKPPGLDGKYLAEV
jgi:hypothetical protein